MVDNQIAHDILKLVVQFRRRSGLNPACSAIFCEACIAPHLHQVRAAVAVKKAITFILPAFPAKSPNQAKVLGVLPDMAEKISLEFLNKLCIRIQQIYQPGAHVILCSDGRVFNDIIGISDDDVSRYQANLLQMINVHSLKNLSTYNLDEVYGGLDFTEMRERLLAAYGDSVDQIRAAVRSGSQSNGSIEEQEVNRQYCGITRFLVEDATRPDQTLSRHAIQKMCRQRAYIVIQRSRAWSDMIALRFPDAVRLSIHPQTCGSMKLGIHLMEAESWMTPWHGVALNVADRFILVKRKQAEKLGAELVFHNGRPSHYILRGQINEIQI